MDIPSKLLRIADIEVCSLRTDTGYARTLKPTCIRANSEIILPVKVACVCSGNEVLLEPNSTLTKLGIMGAKGSVTVKKGKAILRLVNPTEKDVHLKGNKVLAEVSTFNQKSIVCIYEDSDSRLDATVNSTTPSTRNCSDKNIEVDLTDASLSENQKARPLQMLKENKDVFSQDSFDLRKIKLQTHDIDTSDAKPVRTPFYKQTPQMRRKQDKMISDLVENGILRESNSDWFSPVVLVKKADTSETGEYRFAVDYRKLNKVTKLLVFPLPRLSDMLDAIGEANPHFFSSLDLGKAFRQVPLSKEKVRKRLQL